MKRSFYFIAHCGLSALTLFISAPAEPAIGDTIMRIVGDRTPASPDNFSGPTAVEPPSSSVRRDTFIRIIGDKQRAIRKQAAQPEPDQAASMAEEERKAADKAERDRLALIREEQENEAALKAVIEQLAIKYRKAAEQHIASLIAEGERQAAAKMAQLNKIATPNQAGRRHKGVKKRHRKCKCPGY